MIEKILCFVPVIFVSSNLSEIQIYVWSIMRKCNTDDNFVACWLHVCGSTQLAHTSIIPGQIILTIVKINLLPISLLIIDWNITQFYKIYISVTCCFWLQPFFKHILYKCRTVFNCVSETFQMTSYYEGWNLTWTGLGLNNVKTC